MQSSFNCQRAVIRRLLRLDRRQIGPISNGCLATRRNYGSSYKGRDSDAPRNKWFLAFPAVCFCLGTWQIYRRKWKLNLIESMCRRTAQPPIIIDGGSVSELATKVSELEYAPVRLVGEFDHSAEVLIGPRHLIDPKVKPGTDSGGGGSLFSSGAGVGYHVITPFRLADSGERVLVNRGWVPAKFSSQSTRPQGQTTGRIALIGLMRLSEPAGLVGNYLVAGRRSSSGSTESQASRAGVACRLRRDIDALSQELDTLPFFVDACVSPGGDSGSSDAASNYPIAGQTRLSLRNEHLSYVATWYSLGALLTVIWAMKIR